MKRSELKEAIKAEIKSVLSEAKFIKFKGDSDDNKMEVEAEREMNTPDGELKVYTVRTNDGLQSYTADQVELVEENLNEESRFPTQADIDDIENSGNIDIAYDKAMKLLKSLMNKSVSFADIREGTWSSGTYNEIGRFIQDVKNLKDKYYDIVGNDDVFDGLDRAEESAREMMINAPENRSDLNEEEDEDDKAASKSAKKEKLGKQASKLSKEDEDRYDRIKNGLEKLKKKGDEESIKRMKAILGKKGVQKLIKAKGREESSFM